MDQTHDLHRYWIWCILLINYFCRQRHRRKNFITTNYTKISEFFVICCYQVKKENVDSYKPGKRIPRCELFAKFKPETRPIPDLEYRVQLIGAKEPYNTFHIERGGFYTH